MFTMYTMPNCPHCIGAKVLLKSKGFEPRERTAGEHFQRQELIDLLGPVRTLPQIVVEQDGKKLHIGGFAELQLYFAGTGPTPRELTGQLL